MPEVFIPYTVTGFFERGVLVRTAQEPLSLLNNVRKEIWAVDPNVALTFGMANDAGFTPKAVPIKLLFPLLEGASLEENEDLHTMWAALLANAASPANAEKARPEFIAILKQMHPFEVMILERLYDDEQIPVTNENEFRRYGVDESQLLRQPTEQGEIKERLQAMIDSKLSLDGLIAEQLAEKTFWRTPVHGVFSKVDPPKRDEFGYPEQTDFTYTLTTRGSAFVEACRPPKPQA